jgi:hypothetical protein
VLFDTEHSGVGIETVKTQIAASRGLGIVPMVRVPGCHYHLIAPALDRGAIVPTVSSGRMPRGQSSRTAEGRRRNQRSNPNRPSAGSFNAGTAASIPILRPRTFSSNPSSMASRMPRRPYREI